MKKKLTTYLRNISSPRMQDVNDLFQKPWLVYRLYYSRNQTDLKKNKERKLKRWNSQTAS
jgi:uncharacterized RDD family membrane protein YckC